MTIINAHIANSLEWTILKGLSNDVEDFSRSKVMLFAISETNKIPLLITSQDDGCIVATIPEDFEIPTGLTAQTYDTELIWIKNGRDVNRTYQYNVFKVDLNCTSSEQKVKIKSTALVYGYDGLSAYEIAMIKAEKPISENEWLRKLLAEKADTSALLEEIDARQYADTVLNNSIRTEKTNRENADTALSDRIDSESADRQEEDIRLSNRILAEATVRSMFDNNILTLINDINYKIPAAASNTNKLTDKQYVDNLVNQAWDSKADKVDTYTKSEVDSALELKANQTDLESIESKIPSLASASNQLADKEFVNSSISTNTAAFRGTYNLVTDLELAINASHTTIANNIPNVVSSADNNDYVFIQIPISDEQPENIAKVERYKYVVESNNTHWEFEYELNNSGFTAAQWAAVNSGITNNHVQKVNGLDAALAAKLDILTFDSAPTANSFNPVTSNGLYIALLNILSTSGGTINGTLTMHGNIDMLMDALHSWNSIKTTTGRNLFCFKNGFNGYMIGDESIKLGIQTGSNNDVPTPIYHRIIVNGTAVDHPILDTYNLPANVKTINNISVAGAGNIDINDAFKVIYGVTPIADVVNAYLEGKHIYAVNPDLDENFTITNAFVLYFVKIDDVNNTDHKFAFSQYYGDGSDISWFELTSDGYSEIYNSTIATTNDLAAALSDYTTTSDLTTLLNGKLNTVDSSHKLSADVIDDSSATNKFVTASDKTTWNTVTEKAPLPFVVTCGIDPSNVSYVNSTLDEIWTAYQNRKNIRVKFTKAEGISFEDDATLLLDGSRNCVAHTVHNGTHYTITIYEDNNVTKLSYAETHDSDKQDVISDLSTIRSGAASGATAYQKPQSGIPASDIAAGVIPDVSNFITNSVLTTALAAKQDTLVSGTNIKTINNQSILGSGNLDVKDVFIVEYEVTTYQDVVNAYNAGKYLILKYSLPSMSEDYRLLLLEDVTLSIDGVTQGTYSFTFSAISGARSYSVHLTTNGYEPDITYVLQQELTFDNAPTANSYNPVISSGIKTALDNKQDKLVSGTNIKTINNTSVLGSGNLTLENSSNKTNDIANNDTDTTKYPSCKGVADYVSGIVGNINSILETI